MTSKKEERRDTWSESDKSVRQHIHSQGNRSFHLSGSRIRIRKCFKRLFRFFFFLLSDDVRMTLSHSANLSLLQQGCKWICCGLYCCQWKYFQILEVWYLVLIYIKHTGRCSAQHAPPEDKDDIYSQSSFWDWDKQDFCLLFACICICDRSEHPFKPVYQLILYLSYNFPKLMHFEEIKQSIKSSWYREITHRFCRAAFALWNHTCLNTSQLTCNHFASVSLPVRSTALFWNSPIGPSHISIALVLFLTIVLVPVVQWAMSEVVVGVYWSNKP